MITVTQFSDTHFSTPGNRSHGGVGYDTDLAWARSAERAYDPRQRLPDLTIITGDIADNGEPDEYQVAARHIADIPTPIIALIGNHDKDQEFQDFAYATDISADRSKVIDEWQFVFLDSNHDGKAPDANGEPPSYRTRRESNGHLGDDELASASDMIRSANTAHVWLWLHHPPAMSGNTAAFTSDPLNRDITTLLDAHPTIRGLSAGHVHTDIETTIHGRPVYLCPSLTVNIDTKAWTWLPPGYRTYRFHNDGTAQSEVHYIDHPDWPRTPTPKRLNDYFQTPPA